MVWKEKNKMKYLLAVTDQFVNYYYIISLVGAIYIKWDRKVITNDAQDLTMHQ